MVTHQLQVRFRPVKVRRSETSSGMDHTVFTLQTHHTCLTPYVECACCSVGRLLQCTAGCPLYVLAVIYLYPFVAVDIVACIGDKIVASLSPVCYWIQRDTSRPWHKWIVIMSPRYSLQVNRTRNLCPSTSGQHVSWCKRSFRDEAAAAGEDHDHLMACRRISPTVFEWMSK